MQKVLTALLIATCSIGCLDDGRDGAPGPQGPAGEDGRDGESYLSVTNPATGTIVTIPITAGTTGDNAPIDIDVIINDASGDDSAAGTRREDVQPSAP